MSKVSVDDLQISRLISDLKYKEVKVRIINSVKNILGLFNLRADQIEVIRKKLSPDELLVVAEEECDLKIAIRLAKTKYKNKLPPPITVIQWRYKKVIFLGSVRSIVYTLKRRKVDSLVVRLPVNIKNISWFSQAKLNLSQIISKQKICQKI